MTQAGIVLNWAEIFKLIFKILSQFDWSLLMIYLGRDRIDHAFNLLFESLIYIKEIKVAARLALAAQEIERI